MATWVAVLLMLGGAVWVAMLWLRAGNGGLTGRWLDRGDQLASMVSMVLTAAGVMLAYLVWRRPHGPGGRAATSVPAPQRGAAETAEPGEGPVRRDTPPRQLPRATTWFTGRAAELDRLLAMVPAPEKTPAAVVISAIDGMAGIGKPAPGL